MVRREKTTKYDDSGQVFTEVSCRGTPMTSDWAPKRSTSADCKFDLAKADGLVCEKHKNKKIERLADWCFRRQLDSIQTWKAFASAYQFQSDVPSKRKHQIIDNPILKLRDYVNPVSSPSMEWITFLTLSHITCSRTDLVQLAQLPNIGALTIGPKLLAEDVGVDDGIIRSWARTLENSKACGMLRVLSFRSQKHITQRVFGYLAHFPVLTILNFQDCGLGLKHKSDAHKFGWRYKTERAVGDYLVRSENSKANWDSLMHAQFQLAGLYSRIAESVTTTDSLPRLHLTLGGPSYGTTVNMKDTDSALSFYRTFRSSIQTSGMAAPSSSKRSFGHSHPPDPIRVSKRPTIRASKQQHMEALLTDFGG
ncbi:hypothetical protein ACLMJK_000217 [Lecanora helva]